MIACSQKCGFFLYRHDVRSDGTQPCPRCAEGRVVAVSDESPQWFCVRVNGLDEETRRRVMRGEIPMPSLTTEEWMARQVASPPPATAVPPPDPEILLAAYPADLRRFLKVEEGRVVADVQLVRQDKDGYRTAIRNCSPCQQARVERGKRL